MSRPLRLEYAGAMYHVTARGNERRAIFRSDADRRRFLEKLEQLAGVHHVEVYAYALMLNHYHLLLFTPRGNLGAFLQQFNTSYTMYFNRRHSRTGHLFAGRYKVWHGGQALAFVIELFHKMLVANRIQHSLRHFQLQTPSPDPCLRCGTS